MKAVVIGGSGHVGNAVARELLDRDWTVTATGRRERPVNLRGLDVTYLRGDADERGQLDEWIQGQDLVVDAAAPYALRLADRLSAPGSGPVDAALRRAHELVGAVARHGARLAHVSSFATLPDGRDALGSLDAFDRLHAGLARRLHPYFEVKCRVEDELLAAARTGLPVTIVNPTLCLGPWDLKPREFCLVPLLLREEMPVFPRHVVDVVDVRDVAKGLVTAVEQERHGEPVLLSGHSMAFGSLVARICEAGGVRQPDLGMPPLVATVGAVVGEAALSALGVDSVYPALAMMLVVQHRHLHVGRAQRDLGALPRSAWGTIVDSVEWHRSIGSC